MPAPATRPREPRSGAPAGAPAAVPGFASGPAGGGLRAASEAAARSIQDAGAEAATARLGRERVLAMIYDPALLSQRFRLVSDLADADRAATQRDATSRQQSNAIQAVVLGEALTLSRADLPGLIREAERLPEGPDPEPPAPLGRGRSANQALPVDLGALRLSFTLPGSTIINHSREADLLTTAETQVYLTVSTTGIELRMEPPIEVNPRSATHDGIGGLLRGAAPDFDLSTVYYDFTSGTLRVAGDGMLRERVQAALAAVVMPALAGTPLRRPGYNPAEDPNLLATLEQVQANFARLPHTSETRVGAADVRRPSLGATFSLRDPVAAGSDRAGVRIAGGTAVSVSLQLGGSAAEIGGEASAQAMANHVERVSLTSEGITLMVGGSPAARIEALEVSGGQVRVTRVTMLGDARAVGFLISYFGSAVQGAPPQLAGAIAERDGDETIAGITRATLSGLLTEAARGLVGQARGAIPGVDLGEVFHLAPAR
ncbi:MAG: hypothetical protein U1F43_02400 [Myxococcota bacterium]